MSVCLSFGQFCLLLQFDSKNRALLLFTQAMLVVCSCLSVVVTEVDLDVPIPWMYAARRVCTVVDGGDY